MRIRFTTRLLLITIGIGFSIFVLGNNFVENRTQRLQSELQFNDQAPITVGTKEQPVVQSIVVKSDPTILDWILLRRSVTLTYEVEIYDKQGTELVSDVWNMKYECSDEFNCNLLGTQRVSHRAWALMHGNGHYANREKLNTTEALTGFQNH